MRLHISIFLAILLCGRPGAFAGQVTISVLATTDLHGTIYPVDYYTDRPAARGLAKIASLVAAARAENPHSLLIDCGDTIEGSPLEYVYQKLVADGRAPLHLAPPDPPLAGDPMMLVMNQLGYAVMAVGNHEFNFGLRNLATARQDAHFPWISANIRVAPGGREKPFASYVVKQIAGVRVAVIGLTTPAVPTWEKPENLGAYRFLDSLPAVQAAVAELRRNLHPDLIVLAAHSGMGRDLKTGAAIDPAENQVYEIATHTKGLDAIVFGHSHQELAGARFGDVLLVQPKNWGISLARLDFVLEGEPGAWKVAHKEARLLPVTDATPVDPAILRLALPYHSFAERYLNTPVAQAPRPLDGRRGRVEDTALVDAIQAVQLYYSKAEISFTSLFRPRIFLHQGPVTVRQIAALYIYDNQLYSIEGTGQMVKDALENAARYFVSCQGQGCASPPLTDPHVLGFNYDMAEGVRYEIDLTRPVGDRIRNLTWKGRPLAAEQKLLIAVNSYRAAGSGGYGMFAHAKIVWRSTEGIRDLMVRYYTEHRALPAEADENWRIVPEQARRTLERQALVEASRDSLF
ncbi:MAG TPA: 5'-nucleotidase C-terminal domain-containing protein [Bryobacteraceae bacterium]|nr:5'-nucleotidase C-terminal domain-containing protein [Bryobacteraceae bacterium]